MGASPGEPEEIPVAGNGIQWAFGPWRRGGKLSLDLRRQSLDDGSRSRQLLLSGDMQFATYVWQPWFLRLMAGAGAILSGVSTTDGEDSGGESKSGRGLSLVGALSASLFPVSRFPFLLNAEVSDSRTNTDNLSTDYRSYRFGLSQSYRPTKGNESYSAQFDYSLLKGSNGINDALAVLRGTAVRQWDEHTLELEGAHSVNSRSSDSDKSRIWQATARHTFAPESALHMATQASWNRQQFPSSALLRGLETDLLQISTLVNWRPREGDWLYSATQPAMLVMAARLADTSSSSDGQTNRLQSMSLTAGLTKEFSSTWRAAAGASYASFRSGGGSTTNSVSGNTSVSFAPAGANWGEWQYRPSAGLGVSVSDSSTDAGSQTVSLQGAHSLARAWRPDERQALSLQLSQSAAATRDLVDRRQSHGLAHALGITWQGYSEAQERTLVSLSVSDSRSVSNSDGHFRMANLQVSRQANLSRFRNWSASLTAQMSRSSAEEFDAFLGRVRQEDSGWQRFYSGAVSYSDHRFLGIPRLRLTASLNANSQQFERRALGDLNAPLDQVTESAEARLDYRIGLLDTQLSARIVRVEGRQSMSIVARVQRRF